MDDRQPTVSLQSGKYVTTCCNRRIRDEKTCPNCGRPILPLTWDARKAHADHIAEIVKHAEKLNEWIKSRVGARKGGE